MNSFKRVRAFQVELEFGSIGFEVIWTGRLPHLSGLPHLPGVPHLHVKRPLVPQHWKVT